MATTIHTGDITSECVTCTLYTLPEELNATHVTRVETGAQASTEWWAAYVIHADGSRGWQITTDGERFMPREELPA